MDFASVTKKNPKTKKQRKVSPKAWCRLNVAVNPTGTISERRSESSAKMTRSIYQQLDFSKEASDRVDDALRFFDAIDTDFFAECEAKFALDVGSGKFVNDTEWAWFDSVVPAEGGSKVRDDTWNLDPEDCRYGDDLNDWYVECDVCGVNDYGRSNCGCFHVVTPCTFTMFRTIDGAVVPRRLDNVPVLSLFPNPPTGSEMVLA